MFDTLTERQHRTVRGNRVLIALRLLLATLSLSILLLQESLGSRVLPGGVRVPSSSGEVTALLFTPDGKRLYSGGTDASIRVWDLDTGSEAMSAIEGHGDSILRLALSPDGSRLASASADKTVRLYDAQSGKWQAQIPEQLAPISVVAWSSDGLRLITAGSDSPLQLWEVALGSKPKLVATGGVDSERLTFAAFLANDRELVTAGVDGAVRFWKTEDLSLVSKNPAHIRPIETAALSPDGRWLVTGGGILRLWSMVDRTEVRATEAHSGAVTALCFSGDSRQFVSGGQDKMLYLWSVNQAKEVRSFGEHADLIQAIALSPDGTRVATGSVDRMIRLWDATNGKKIRELAGHRKTLRSGYPLSDTKHIVPVQQTPLYLRPEGLVVLIVLLLTLLYSVGLKRPELAPRLAYLQIVVDIGLISALVYDTGGVDSPFVTLYLISIAAAAFVLSWRGAIMMAALAATLFSVITLAYGLGQIPESYVNKVSEAQLRKFRDPGLLDYVRLLLLPICAFFLIAVLAGNLARRLAVARLLHHEVLEGIGEGILVLDLDCKVLYHNQEIRKLMLFQTAIEHHSLGELLGEAVREQAQRVLVEGTGRRLEISHRRRDGVIMPFEVRIIPVLEPDGPPRGLIVVLDDITAEKKMEEFFKHKERIEAMGQISATIAHEIRNPLASIRGAVQEIARSVEIPESKKILIEIVLSESDRLDQIITDFLRYARMRPPKLTSVDIVQLLSDLRMLLVSRQEAKEIQISLEAPDDVSPLLADAEQLRQIFLNLGVNAMQALDGRTDKKIIFRVLPTTLHKAQGIDSHTIMGRMDRPGVCVEVRDNGSGMPADVREQIFEPFYTTKPNGTGLGLAIVARIVQGHEGLIRVESKPAEGTAFQVWLPSDLNAERLSGIRKVSADVTRS